MYYRLSTPSSPVFTALHRAAIGPVSGLAFVTSQTDLTILVSFCFSFECLSSIFFVLEVNVVSRTAASVCTVHAPAASYLVIEKLYSEI